MGRSLSNALRLAVAIISLWSLGGCGKTAKPGPPNFPGRINLSPAVNTSMVLGATLNFTASVQTASGGNVATPVTYTSSDTSVLTLAPNGVACAGHWDVAFTTCIPGGTGLALVTASALGAFSVPTYVFVHPPIDNITVTGVLLNGISVQEPCLSQTQTMTVEAHAFSQGTDITSSVGPFSWSANNPAVVSLVPLVNIAYNFPTNQATAKAASPGFTQIYASASGVTSSSFLQPQYQNSQGTTSPPLDFFETCPILSIALEVGNSGTQQTGQTTFVTSKGTSQNATAVITDVIGNSSLPNTNGSVVLKAIPLTWSASQPGVLSAAPGCTNSCSLSTPLPGSGSVTASCSPPSCNIGFPLVPQSLSTQALIDSCTNFFQGQTAPTTFSCQQLIPVPVYASPLPPNLIAPSCVPGPDTDCPGVGAISGIITGATAGTSLLATSTGCSHEPPVTCSASIYSLSTAKNATGPENPLPVPPNSLLFDLAGDRAFMGSDFGAQIVNPTNFGSSNNPYTPLGTVTGNVLAASPNGNTAVFSDTIHTPNQVYVVNAASNSLSANPLNISQAVTAGFSPDGLKTFIVGNSGNSLYIYSTQQALQGPIALTGPANSVGFSPNGAFAFVAQQAPSPSGSANLSAFSTCNNQLAANLLLPANPLFMRVLPGLHIDGADSYGYPIPDGMHVLVMDATGFDVITATISAPQPGTLCPQALTFVSKDPLHAAQRIELGQGKLQPVNFFVSADSSSLYIASTGNASILVYNFNTGAVTGIELLGSVTPLSADMSADAGTILVAGSDGMLHEISTALGGFDQFQLTFPSLPNYLNPFCTFTPTQGACTFNTVLARP
jgi:hypothetical protein